ncbi:hypothetical protein SNEBB_006018 [Seison nebaliae]|nr:hypothetical protein SNEBB_006018 [Seison nebaliae]
MSILFNVREFSCSICMKHVKLGHGIMLPICRENVCKTCLRNHVNTKVADTLSFKDVPCISCQDETLDYNLMKYVLKRREMEELEEKFIKNWKTRNASFTFNCLTPNCAYFFEIGSNTTLLEEQVIKCPNCSLHSCLTCKKQHTPSDMCEVEAAEKSADYFAQQIQEGTMMLCLNCETPVSRIDGCDAVRCQCGTELCWATKKLRRGSNGCHCRSPSRNGALCHPNCRNCH